MRSNYLVSSHLVSVLSFDILFAGFSCRTLSALIVSRGDERFADCLREHAESTGETYAGAQGYLRSKRPAPG